MPPLRSMVLPNAATSWLPRNWESLYALEIALWRGMTTLLTVWEDVFPNKEDENPSISCAF